MKAIKKGIEQRNMADVISAYEELIFHPSVPHDMAWGRRQGVYHGEHIVRKLWLCDFHGVDGWKLETVADIKRCGPDKCQYLQTLPREWSASRVRTQFAPLDPSRLSMWACLIGLAFKRSPEVREACAAGQISKDLFAASALAVQKKLGHNPHVEDVLQEAVSKLPSS